MISVSELVDKFGGVWGDENGNCVAYVPSLGDLSACFLYLDEFGSLCYTSNHNPVNSTNWVVVCTRSQFEQEVLERKQELVGEVVLNTDMKAIDLIQYCHEAAVKSGWWHDLHSGEKLPPDTPKKLMLVVSELAEAMEADRKDLMDDKLPHRHGVEVELADAVIRIFDLAGRLECDLMGAIVEKLEFNANRPDHKPENRIKENGKDY